MLSSRKTENHIYYKIILNQRMHQIALKPSMNKLLDRLTGLTA